MIELFPMTPFFPHIYLVTSLSLMQFMLQGVATMDVIFWWQKSMHSVTWNRLPHKHLRMPKCILIYCVTTVFKSTKLNICTESRQLAPSWCRRHRIRHNRTPPHKPIVFIVFLILLSFCSLLFHINCVFWTKYEPHSLAHKYFQKFYTN